MKIAGTYTNYIEEMTDTIREDMDRKLLVASPLLPPLDEFTSYLEDIWERKWLTNNGYYHNKLEEALCEYLDVPYVSLFTNGTLPIMTALQVLDIKGEVITTPYSFVATAHSLLWNGLKPVFVDIDPVTCNIDPDKIEEAITPQTTAIMPVHVYGNPCDTMKIQRIADRHQLKVIYDAAHTFGVTVNDKSILEAGNLSTLSFHATKVFNTIEGGALVCHDRETKERIDNLKNFGFTDETTVVASGINGKMDELRSAYGLVTLKYVDKAIEVRQHVANRYQTELQHLSGISFIRDIPDKTIRRNYSYFPVFVNAESYGITRDELYLKMKEKNIFGRRYFYPLISTFPMYEDYPSADKANLTNAHKVADSVICLPIHHGLTDGNVDRILEVIIENSRNS